MRPYQEQYVENVREIARLSDFYSVPLDGFERWYRAQSERAARVQTLRAENVRLLEDHLFPLLDGLHGAAPEEVAALEEFADVLMDWKTNLDCGVYVLIHDALLSLCRVRRDRDGVIRELYKLGMGLYYHSRSLQGLPDDCIRPFRFENEMAFTEGGSYLKYFDRIESEETKGYVIRALANVAICTMSVKKRISVSRRMLEILQDPDYRALAPDLPWDRFLQNTHQQMCSNRFILGAGDLTREELAAVLESCQIVFSPESKTENPNVRWLWPYYEMEFSCGFVDLETTLARLETLILRTPYDKYDMSGLYGNVQLAIYYGDLMKKNPQLRDWPRHVRFLARAYKKMMRCLLSCPAEQFGEFYFYEIRLVFTDYFETPGVEDYRAVTERLIQRVAGRLYVRSLRVGAVLERLCRTILDAQPGFFDDIEHIRAIADPEEKRAAVLDFARSCGLYQSFGHVKMNMERTRETRSLFEREDRMLMLHTVAGAGDLRSRASTAVFADVALGHHSWYNGAGGFPEQYVRNASPVRQMTDATALAVYLCESYRGDLDALLADVLAQEGKRFSPLITAFLSDAALRRDLEALLQSDDEPWYRALYDRLTA